MTASGRREFATFLFVGAVNTLFAYSVYAAGYLAGLSPPIALLLATPAGVLFNFVTTGRIVFRSSRLSALPRFLALASAVYVVNVLGLSAVMDFGLHPLPGQAAVLTVTAPLSFLAAKYLVFAASVESSSKLANGSG